MPVPALNVDLGELPAEPEALWALADLVSIACGGHAGDEATMRLALARCRRHGTAAGAHPSFVDRAGFGRVAQAVDAATLGLQIVAQLGALAEAAEAEGVALGHLKPHGALYHAADADPALAEAVVDATAAVLGPVRIVGPPGGALERAAARVGLPYWREGFADRGYGPDGRLLPRGTPGALLDAEAAAAQAVRLADAFDTLGVHGDSPGAVEVLRAVRAALGVPR